MSAFKGRPIKPGSTTAATVVAEAFVGRYKTRTRLLTTPDEAAANGWEIIGTAAEIIHHQRPKATSKPQAKKPARATKKKK